ncbi:MAG: hypothetical protein IKF17_04090 [Clostridia bacterium]|nr:hypothetical protein [Clostridia bacterium]
MTICYNIAAAIIQPIAEPKIIKLLEEMGNVFKLLLAIISGISVMFIVGITLVIKISDTGMMYR